MGGETRRVGDTRGNA